MKLRNIYDSDSGWQWSEDIFDETVTIFELV
jgi:hypothetical protein